MIAPSSNFFQHFVINHVVDDCWQKCNAGPGGVGFHNASGYPIVDEALFPDMRAMTTRAKALGITPGW